MPAISPVAVCSTMADSVKLVSRFGAAINAILMNNKVTAVRSGFVMLVRVLSMFRSKGSTILTIFFQHLFFFLGKAVYAAFADLVQNSVNLFLLVEFAFVVFVVCAVMILMRAIKKIIDQQNMWSCNDQVNEYDSRHRNDQNSNIIRQKGLGHQ